MEVGRPSLIILHIYFSAFDLEITYSVNTIILYDIIWNMNMNDWTFFYHQTFIEAEAKDIKQRRLDGSSLDSHALLLCKLLAVGRHLLRVLSAESQWIACLWKWSTDRDHSINQFHLAISNLKSGNTWSFLQKYSKYANSASKYLAKCIKWYFTRKPLTWYNPLCSKPVVLAKSRTAAGPNPRHRHSTWDTIRAM